MLPRNLSLYVKPKLLCIACQPYSCHSPCAESVEGDSHVFGVTPDFGLLGSKEHRVTSSSQCLQISFTPG